MIIKNYSMLGLVFLLSMLTPLLQSCSGTSKKFLVIPKTSQIEIIPKPQNPDRVTLLPIEWYGIKGESTDMYICLNGKGYAALDINMAKILSLTKQYDALIKYYEKVCQ